MIKVLLVEDNKEINDNVRLYLQNEFEVHPVFSGEDAILYLDACIYDLVILDLMLPGLDGMSVLGHIKKKALNIGVLMLTAKEDLNDKLRAFDLGAQDYLTKPFFMEELKARIKIILKSMGKLVSDHTLVFKDLQIDLSKNIVTIRGEKVDLNERLYNLLEYFMLNQGILLFKEQIFERICGYDSDASTEIVEVYMSHLRKKLNTYKYGKYLVTKRGMGYILEEDNIS
ncbi:response regulator transcription factor [Cellulosilyticum ruminicola]|uniref:response regulator transcription factor n=1 Tax=Cellulosilyticum ruminicola TaxID=425254 RepID=UPI0006D2C4B5|nr:response regulator transcription factor [Cellulosilyticum ruminicola]